MQSNIYYIYIHYKKSNLQPFYVGKGKNNRAFEIGAKRNPHWKNIVKKHGVFIQIMERNLTEVEAFEREKYYIQILGKENLCNITDGGEGCSGVSPWNKGLCYNVGENNPMYGRVPWNKNKTHSEATKKKLSAASKGKIISDETRKKISDASKGKRRGEKNPMYNKVVSDETRRKISERLKGKRHSDEVKQKISTNRKGKGGLKGAANPKSKKVINTETGEIYPSLRFASGVLNINYYTFFNYLNGRVKNKTQCIYYECNN